MMENNKLPKGGVFDKAIKNHRAIDEITNLLLATNKIKLDEPVDVATQRTLYATQLELQNINAHRVIEQIKDDYLRELLESELQNYKRLCDLLPSGDSGQIKEVVIDLVLDSKGIDDFLKENY